MSNHNREVWLHRAIGAMRRSIFAVDIPPVKVSVGLPYGRGGKKAIGQHWSPEASDDKVSSIFISPTINDTEEVLSTLVHELVHAVVGNKYGHGAKFRSLALSVGLEGKMRSAGAGPELLTKFQKVIKKIGKYPHAKLNLGMNPVKKQGTRLIKMECENCGYIARTAKKNLVNFGPVICPCNKEPMAFEAPDEEEDG